MAAAAGQLIVFQCSELGGEGGQVVAGPLCREGLLVGGGGFRPLAGVGSGGGDAPAVVS